MAGRLPREHGVWSNAIGADEDGPSHVRNIRDAGYRTAVIGKTHLWRVGPGVRAGMHAREMDHNQGTIDALIGDYLAPLRARADLDKLASYRAYVRRTGSIN